MRGGGRSFVSVAWRRFRQLIVPYALWSAPCYLACRPATGVADFLLYPHKGLWFLWALFFIALLGELVHRLCATARLPLGVVATLCALALAGVQATLRDAKWLAFQYVAFYYIFYMLGFCARGAGLPPMGRFRCGALLALWLVMACFWTPNGIPPFLSGVPCVPSGLLRLAYRTLTPCVFVAWMFSFVPRLETRPHGFVWCLLNGAGRLSIGIYVIHMTVKGALAVALLGALPALPLWAHTVLEFFLLTGFSWAAARAVQSSPAASKWLLGKV